MREKMAKYSLRKCLQELLGFVVTIFSQSFAFYTEFGEENVFILCKVFQKHTIVDKSEFPLSSVMLIRMTAVLKITQD